MTDRGKDMSELLILKIAAKEINLDPSHLRREIGLGKLPADKFGGRDWWIIRSDLLAWDAQRRAVGRPRDTVLPPAEDEARQRRREYLREYQRNYRTRQKQAAKPSKRPVG